MSPRVRRITVAERRTRLARRHHLAAQTRAQAPLDVAESLVGLHGTTPATVHVAAALRMRRPDIGAVERALYDDRTMLRYLGMRRTVFALPLDLVPAVRAACTEKVNRRERQLALRMIVESQVADGDPQAWLARAEDVTEGVLRRIGPATGAQVAAADPMLATRITLAAGRSYQGSQSVGSRVLGLLGADLRAVRGRPNGGWTSGQFRWWATEAWLSDPVPTMSVEAASVVLARRWLAAYGPAPVADLRWWAGWTVAQTRAALAAIEPVEVDLDGQPGMVLAGDDEPPEPVEPWAALLPTLDPTVMGWSGSGRGFFLGPHAGALFDRNGNAGPTVWLDGRIVGGWAQRGDGEIVDRLLEDVGADGRAAIDAARDRLAALLDGTRVASSFRSPLERELTS